MRLDGLNAVALVVYAAALASLLHGCAGTLPGAQAPDAGRRVTERVMRVAQTTLDALVVIVEPAITQGIRECGDNPCAVKWQDARRAYRATRDALSVVQDAYQSYLHAADDESDWLASLSCARSAAASLIVALDRVGVHVPDPLISAVESIAIYLGPCADA